MNLPAMASPWVHPARWLLPTQLRSAQVQAHHTQACPNSMTRPHLTNRRAISAAAKIVFPVPCCMSPRLGLLLCKVPMRSSLPRASPQSKQPQPHKDFCKEKAAGLFPSPAALLSRIKINLDSNPLPLDSEVQLPCEPTHSTLPDSWWHLGWCSVHLGRPT